MANFSRRRRFSCQWSACMLAACCLGVLGCDSERDEAAKKKAEDTGILFGVPGMPAGKHWEAAYINGTKVGYAETDITYVLEGKPGPRIDFKQQMILNLARDGQATDVSLSLEGTETSEGKLREYESRMKMSRQQTITRGKVEGNTMQLTVQAGGKTQKATVPLPDDVRGFFAIERELAANPLKTGETREFPVFDWTLLQVVPVTLKAEGRETTQLLDGSHELQRIKQTVLVSDRQRNAQITITASLWIDENGKVLKRHDDTMGVDFYVTTEEIATKEGGKLDLFNFSIVKLEQPLANPYESEQATYRVRLKNTNPAKAFPQSQTQRVDSIDDRSAEVTVRRLTPQDDLWEGIEIEQPTKEDLEPNSLIQSDDARILRMAKAVSTAGDDPYRLARALEKSVKERMNAVAGFDYSQGFASAAEVAQTLQGDCTEHAVLLAALCRAREIPARVAMGLIYARGQDGFLYHMWTEAWVGDRWVPLDGTVANGGDAARLKVGHSSLAGATPYDSFLPVVQVLGNLEIEVVGAADPVGP